MSRKAQRASEPADDLPRLLHELKVHQVELEVQNEELRRMRDELEGALSRQTELYDLAPVGYMTLGSAGEIRALNLEAARLLGLPRAALVARSLATLLAPEGAAALRRLLLDGAGATVAPLARPASTLRLETGQGRGDEISVVVRDVTELSRTEVERARLASVVEQLDTAVSITDRHGEVVFVNAAHERHTGHSRRESVGQRSRVFASDAIGPALRSGKTWSGRREDRRKDGSVYVEDVTVSPLRDEAGALTHFVVLQRDVTEQVALADELQLSRRMEAVGRLAGGVAHDFNNMLLVIQNAASFCLSEVAEGSQMRADLLTIIDAATRSASLTRQLLAFGRQQILRPVSVSLDALVQGMSRMLGRLLREDVRLVVHAEAGLWPVFADPGQIEQIVVNLAVNAQDAMPEGGKLEITLANVLADHPRRGTALEGASATDFVCMTVRDTGVGMDEEVRAHIFEPFFSTKKERGTGLGLATVYGIVRQSNGFIECESRPGEGAEFRVFLPRATTSVEEPEPAPPHTEGQRGKILLVEDEERVRTTTRRLLASAGHEVLTACNGEEALAVCREHAASLDLVLSDVVMPVMGGAELRRRLREDHPALPIVLMSGHPPDVGDADILPKPFNRAQLLARIDQHLARRR